MSFTFSEQSTNSFFTILVLERTAYGATMVIGPLSDVDRTGAIAVVVDTFRAMGFAAVLPPETRVTTLRRGTFGALINLWDDQIKGVTIALGDDDRITLQVVIDQLLVRFPDAVVTNDRGASRS
jgi:hypothetical protein